MCMHTRYYSVTVNNQADICMTFNHSVIKKLICLAESLVLRPSYVCSQSVRAWWP